MLVYLKCSLSEGFRASEKTAELTRYDGRIAEIRLPANSFGEIEGENYMAAGLIEYHKSSDSYLVELPYEADTGENRIWIRANDVRLELPQVVEQ